MRLLKLFFGLAFILLFSILGSGPFSGCTKHMTDTVYIKHDSAILVYDTTVVHDTTTIHDTSYDITSGLVAYFNFNGGNLNDSSGYNNNITFNNATPTTDRFGRPNNAYLFNGSSSYMSVNNSPSLNPNGITLYAIFKVNGFYSGLDYGNFVLVKGWDQADGMYIIQYNTFFAPPGVFDTTQEYLQAGYGDNNNTSDAAGKGYLGMTVHSGNWYKLTFTYDGITAKTYLNGSLVATDVRTVTFTQNTYDVFIGRNEDPYNLYPFWFNGVIDEIRIYNRALPTQAVTQLNNLTN
jgi:Concanavalin A-like lectin/glucanases superfamily